MTRFTRTFEFVSESESLSSQETNSLINTAFHFCLSFLARDDFPRAERQPLRVGIVEKELDIALCHSCTRHRKMMPMWQSRIGIVDLQVLLYLHKFELKILLYFHTLCFSQDRVTFPPQNTSILSCFSLDWSRKDSSISGTTQRMNTKLSPVCCWRPVDYCDPHIIGLLYIGWKQS